MLNITNIKEKNNIIFIMVTFLVLSIICFLRYPDLRNEMKYFVVVSEMIEKGNYFVMTYLGELYPDKPPLYFWLLIFLKNITPQYFYPLALIFGGVVPFILSAFIIERIFKTYTVSIVFITTVFATGVSVILRMDTLMSFFITLSLVNFYTLYTNGSECEVTDIAINDKCDDKYDSMCENKYKIPPSFGKVALLVYFPMAIAILVKGGSGILTPLVTILFFLYLNKDFSYLKKIKIWWGIALILCIVAGWLLLILTEDGGREYVSLLLGQQTVGRAVNAFTHKRPSYFYLLHLPLITMPYGIALIFTVYTYIKDFKNRLNWTTLEKFCFSWTFAPLLLFSLISGKLDIYILPTFPGIIGLIWCYFLRKKEHKEFKTLYLFPKIVLGVLTLLIFAIPKFNHMMTLKYLTPVIREQNSAVPILLFSSPDGINYLLKIDAPYKNIMKPLELQYEFEKGEQEYLVFGRFKYYKYLEAPLEHILSQGYKKEILFENKDYYFFKLKKIK